MVGMDLKGGEEGDSTGRIWKGRERKEGLEGLISRGREEGNERKI